MPMKKDDVVVLTILFFQIPIWWWPLGFLPLGWKIVLTVGTMAIGGALLEEKTKVSEKTDQDPKAASVVRVAALLSAAIQRLESKGAVDRRSVWQVGRLAGPDTLPRLLAALRKTSSPAPGLVEALGRLPITSAAEMEEACQAVEDALAGKHAPVLPCVEALTRFAQPRSISVFTRLLVENWQFPDVTSRLLAIVALAKIGSAAGLPPLLHALAGRVSSGVLDTCTWNQLVQRTEMPLPVYGGGDVSVPTLAAWALGRTGSPEAIAPLVEALRKRAMDKEFQQVAMFALTDVTSGYMDHLRPMLNDFLARVRYAVFLALRRKAPAAHLEEFRAALQDSDEWVRFAAACGLALAGSNEGVPALLALLDKWLTDPKLKPAIYSEVAQLRMRDMLPEAFNRATMSWKSDASLRAAATQAVRSIVSGMSTEELLAVARPERWVKKDVSARMKGVLSSGLVGRAPALVGVLGAAEDTILPVLNDTLDKATPIVRSRPAVADLLVASGLARDLKPWIRRLDDKNPYVSELAFVVLNVSRDPACQPRLLEILEQVPTTGALGRLFGVDKTKKPDYVRRKVLTCVALSSCGTEAALSPLLKWIGQANTSIRVAAGAALVEVSLRHLSTSQAAGVPEALLTLWSVRSYSLRAALAFYFGQAGYERAAPSIASELEEAYGAGPFARYREVLITALSRMNAAMPPAPSPAREIDVLAREVKDKPEDDGRFRELLKFETLMTHSYLDYEKADPAHLAFQVYPRIMPQCCAVCLGEPERTLTLSFAEAVSGVSGVRTITRFVPVPMCSRCRHVSDASGEFTPMSMEKKDGVWAPAFVNPRYATMALDNAWLATGTYYGRRIFMAGLADVVESVPAATDSEAKEVRKEPAPAQQGPGPAPVARGEAAEPQPASEARELFDHGKRRFQERDWEAARAAFEKVLAKAPGHLNAQFFLGASLAELGQLGEALPLIERCVEAEPEQLDFQNTLGMVLGKLGRIEEAERHMARAAFLGHPQARGILENTGMGYCRNCAAPMKKGSAVCPRCGAA